MQTFLWYYSIAASASFFGALTGLSLYNAIKTGQARKAILKQLDMVMKSQMSNLHHGWNEPVSSEKDPIKLGQIVSPDACCENERRNMNGGCDNCGDPCY